MHLRMRFIGKALEYMNAKGHDDRRMALQVSPELVHVGDLLRHPVFGGSNVYVVAREVDFIDRCVTVWVDVLPGTNLDSLYDGALETGEPQLETPVPATASSVDD